MKTTLMIYTQVHYEILQNIQMSKKISQSEMINKMDEISNLQFTPTLIKMVIFNSQATKYNKYKFILVNYVDTNKLRIQKFEKNKFYKYSSSNRITKIRKSLNLTQDLQNNIEKELWKKLLNLFNKGCFQFQNLQNCHM